VTGSSTTLRARERREPHAGGALLAGFGAAALYAVGTMQELLVPMAVVAPFPLLAARLRHGAAAALAGLVLATAALAALRPGAAGAFALVALPMMLVAEATARGRGLRRGCLWAFGWLSFVIGAGLVFANGFVESVTFDTIARMRSEAFLEGLRASGWQAEQVDAWIERVAVTDRVMRVVYPAVYLIMGALMVLANGAALRLWLAFRDPGWLEGNELEGLRWPFALAFVFVAAGLGVLVPPARPAAYNALLLLAFFFGLQGLAVVVFYASRLAAPPLMRWAVLVLVLVNPWAPYILALMGLFDLWFDFRKWAEPPAPQRG
jgi:hypothetical protein